MNIAYVCTDFGIPVHGAKGASIHVRELSRALAEAGHAVRIYTPRAGGPPPPGFHVAVREVPLDAAGRRVFDAIAADPAAGRPVAAAVRALAYAGALPHRIAAEVAAFAPDVVYERHALFGTAGLALARVLGVPLVVEVNAPLADEHAQHRGLAFPEAARLIERETLRAADHVLPVSDALGDWLAGLGVDRARITMLPNGVDPRRFAVGDAARQAARDAIGVPLDRTVVGFVGTLKPWHDVAALVRAVGDLAGRGAAVHLLVVGDGPERAALEALAGACGLAGAATFTGAVPHDAVPAWTAAMDVAVAPYAAGDDAYFSPLKVFEAMAAGRPVVAAAVGQLPRVVRHGETGLLYDPADATSLAAALRALVDDPGLAGWLGAAGREWVARHRTWRHNADRVADIAAGLAHAPVRAVLGAARGGDARDVPPPAAARIA